MKTFNELLNEQKGTIPDGGVSELSGGGEYYFWLVTKATSDSELIDVISKVDIGALYNIARGSRREDDSELELFPLEMKDEAYNLAKKRIDEATNPF